MIESLVIVLPFILKSSEKILLQSIIRGERLFTYILYPIYGS